MSIQTLYDSDGKPIAVVLPISEWEEIKARLEELDESESENVEIPEWHKAILDERLKEYRENPRDVVDVDQALDAIEKELEQEARDSQG